ncbi:DUF6088 family protein [Roseomonas sp. 18066]|uniref:DUF6088 family protein n=1 Tax=Roseomonas sp. 18066 TaxID=2681412 RepID=UPI00135A9CAE|nr:DUF6088 family protein [Roseomonas sp. 18066]
MSVMESILTEAGSLPEGSVLNARTLSHLGERGALDQAFSRLAREGRLIRAARGLYVHPVQGRFGVRPPSPAKVAERLAEATGEPVLPAGAAEANRLGLTTQVPVREVFVTTGAARKLKLGARTLEIQHAPKWQTVLPGTEAGAAVRALAWLGKREVGRAAARLHASLPQSEWKALIGIRSYLPAWMAASIGVEMRGQRVA